jgi:hypothetical protein
LLDARAAVAGAIGFLWLAAHGLLLLIVLNLVSGSVSHPNYYDRLAALPRLEAQALLAGLTALVGWLGLRRLAVRACGLAPGAALAVLGWAFGGPNGLILVTALIAMLAGWFAPVGGIPRWGGWLCAIGMLLFAAALLQMKAPMAAWIVAWPVMIVAVTAAVLAWSDPDFDKPWSWAIAALAFVVVITPLIPLAHLAFLGIGAPLPEAMLAFLLIVAAAIWPLARIEGAGCATLLVTGAFLVAGLAIAIHVRADPIAEPIPAYSLDK